jgi:hypothetical protein
MDFTENLEYGQRNEAFWPEIAVPGFSVKTQVLLNVFERLNFFFVLALFCVLGNTMINLVVRITICSAFLDYCNHLSILFNPCQF